MELVNIGETDVNSETKNIASPIQGKKLLHDVNSVKLFMSQLEKFWCLVKNL